MIPASWREGEVAVVGLGRSGVSASRLLRKLDLAVYASDAARSADLERAAAELGALGVAISLGGHDLARLSRARAAVISPGVPPEAPPAAALREAGVPVVAELDLAARCLTGSRLIAVTGTSGKSTTTALVAHLLRAAGYDAAAAGNIGVPLSDFALQLSPPAYLAVEASSFQLHDAPSLAPVVGVLTNLSADHLDRYPSVEEYYADKALLFRNATAESRWVVNGDDQRAAAMARPAAGRHERFSLLDRSADGFFDRVGGSLLLRGAPVMRRGELKLLGDHNVLNALAAALAVPPEADRRFLAEGLGTFRPLPHRLEPVGEVGGVVWINDSKSTKVASTLMAIRSIERPLVLLLGGRHKGASYAELGPALRERARAVVTYGEAAGLIQRDLQGAVRCERSGSFEEVVRLAATLARPGDAVVLSPACSSFDMFGNYEERGERFRELAGGLA